MDPILTIAGFLIGALVGMTGVGAGSLMPPFLLLYGIPPAVAVGTDLAYARRSCAASSACCSLASG